MNSVISKTVNIFWRVQQRLLYKLGLRKSPRAHREILEDNLKKIVSKFDKPVVIETGCIRSIKEGTESTLVIASFLNGEGKFYSFELEASHIDKCKNICKDYNQFINYVQGDSVEQLSKLKDNKQISEIHLAFFDSVNDGEHIFNEFKTVEDLFVKGSIVIVDDVIWADKGNKIKPYLNKSSFWDVKVYNRENGILVAEKIV